MFIWWLIAQALGLIGLPFAGLLFRSLPDAGYPFAKALGLLLTGYVAWLLAMFGLGRFGPPLLILSALSVAGLGLWVTWRTPYRPRLPAWPTLIGYELIFLSAMLACIWLRSYDPTPWGTERPMDFAFFNAIQRSANFPPHDPWLAGYSINYYYFGYLLMASVAQLSGLAPSLAYNLALALIVGLTALGVAGIIANLIALASPTAQAWWGASMRWFFATLGVIFVLVAGNQSGAIQVLLGDERAVALNGSQLITAAGQALGGAETITLETPAPTGDFGTLTGWERRDMAAPGAFNWWWPSRSLWDTYTIRESEQAPRQERRYAITEFPFFSFRLGDMHPHVMSLPFSLLALALALATLAHREPPTFTSGRMGWAELLVSGVILGSLYAINSWDLPTYLLLYAGAALLLHQRQSESGAIPWRTYFLHLTLIILSAFLLFLPFYLTFHSLVGAAAPLIDLPILGKLTSIIAPYPASRSGLHTFLIIFGLFALPLSAFVYLVQPIATNPTWVSRITHPAALPLLLLLIGLLIGFPLLALLGLGILAIQIALRSHLQVAERFALLVITLGCAIIFGTEIIYIRDVFEGWSTRFNTIFKFYYQVWLLWGTLAPFGLWYILSRTTGIRRMLGVATTLLTLGMLGGASVYPLLTLRDMSLGTAQNLDAPTPREESLGGQEAIAWLRHNAAPGSIILETTEILNSADIALGSPPACGGSYNGAGYAGVSTATGLPTILGWPGHEQQWRGGDPSAAAELQPRCVDVYRIYATTDSAEAKRLLAHYGVTYIYVGGLERATYPPQSLAKFAQIATPTSFGDGDVIIYTLTQSANTHFTQ